MTDVEFFKVGKDCINQADIDTVVADIKRAKTSESYG